MKNVYALVALLWLYTQQSFALQKIFIFHINGINTTQAEAIENCKQLNRAINPKSNLIGQNGNIDLLYNKEPQGGSCQLCKELDDIWNQKRFENLSLDDFVIAYIKKNHLNIQPGTPEYEALKSSIKDKYFEDPEFMGSNFTDILGQFKQKVNVGPDLRNLLSFIDNTNTSNKPKPYILLLPHSQGNLYANNLYKALTINEGYNEHNLSIYGTGTPAANNLGNYISQIYFNDPGYLTSSNDEVINALRRLAAIPPVQPVLPANITIPRGHQLISCYLANPLSRNQIVNNVNQILDYFWLNILYSDFEDVGFRSKKSFRPGVKAIYSGIEEDGSTNVGHLAVESKCKGLYYFVLNNPSLAPELPVGYQCILENS